MLKEFPIPLQTFYIILFLILHQKLIFLEINLELTRQLLQSKLFINDTILISYNPLLKSIYSEKSIDALIVVGHVGHSAWGG